MAENKFNIVSDKIDNEGFDYCFDGYSHWDEIKDPEFHRLRQAYLDAKEALGNYVFINSDAD